MNPDTIFDKVRKLLTKILWKTFLWSIKMTEKEYLRLIYKQGAYHNDE